jgi:formylglycine-generating enzyme required for sulfatase activity
MRTAASILLVIISIAIVSCRSRQVVAPANMVWIAGGTFWMGCEGCGMPDALPAHLVSVEGFWMDQTPVTNAEFERFVNATGYGRIEVLCRNDVWEVPCCQTFVGGTDERRNFVSGEGRQNQKQRRE